MSLEDQQRTYPQPLDDLSPDRTSCSGQMPSFEPKAVPHTRAAIMPPSGAYLTSAIYASDVLQTHCKHVANALGSARLGYFGVEHEQSDECLGAWIAIANDGRLLFLQTPFRETGTTQWWTNTDHFIAASQVFVQTVEDFAGEELLNNAATDGTWERYLGNLLRDEFGLVRYSDLVS
jgi:hypothetical protein